MTIVIAEQEQPWRPRRVSVRGQATAPAARAGARCGGRGSSRRPPAATPRRVEADQLERAAADLAQQRVAHERRRARPPPRRRAGARPAGCPGSSGGSRRARRQQQDADGVARARREDVVDRVAHDGQGVHVGARGVGADVREEELPPLGAHHGGQRVERDGADEGGSSAGRRGRQRRLLAQRPPHDAGDGDERDEQPEQRRARTDADAGAPACGRSSGARAGRPGVGVIRAPRVSGRVPRSSLSV